MRFFLKAWTYRKVHIQHINILQETGPKYFNAIKMEQAPIL